MEDQKQLDATIFRRLVHLAHTDKKEVFHQYVDYYRSTSGQIYWSDTQYLSTYIDNYHHELDQKLDVKDRATEVITTIEKCSRNEQGSSSTFPLG